MKTTKNKICSIHYGKRLSVILFFSLCFIFIGNILPSKAVNVVAIDHTPETGLIDWSQNSIGGWAGQSFVATEDNISGVIVRTGVGGYATSPSPYSWTTMYVELRNSSNVTIASSTNTTQINFVASTELPAYFDSPVSMTVGNTYSFVVVFNDTRMTYAMEDSGTYADGASLDGGSSRDVWFQVLYEDGTTGSDDYVMYYGNSPAYTNLGGNYDLPVVYNVCDNFNASSTTYLVLHDVDEYDLADGMILTACSGSVVYNVSAGTVQHSENAHFHIYDSGTVDVQTAEFLNNVDYQVLDQEDYIHYYYPQGLYIDTSVGAGTTTVNFAYSVCSDTNWASSTIWLKNEDSGNTAVSYTPLACTGNGVLEFPYTQNLNLSFPATISYQNGGIEKLKSSVFNVVFWSYSDIDLGTDATSTNVLVAFGRAWWNRFINIFPFNIPVAMRTAWRASETADLPSDLQFLDVSETNGDINASFPKEWLGTSTDMTFTLFGRDKIANGSADALVLFENFRKFSKYLQWFVFIWAIIYLAKKVITDMTNDKNDNLT